MSQFPCLKPVDYLHRLGRAKDEESRERFRLHRGMVSYYPEKGRWEEGIWWEGDRCMLRGDKNDSEDDSAGLQHSHCMLACWDSGMSPAWRWMCLTQAASPIALLLFSLLQNTGNTMLHADLAITEQAKQKSLMHSFKLLKN